MRFKTVFPALAGIGVLLFLFSYFLHVEVPPDFEIIAQYYPGNSGWGSWKVKVSSDGAIVDDDLELYISSLARYRKELFENKRLSKKARQKIPKEIEYLEEALQKRKNQIPEKLSRKQVSVLYATVCRAGFMQLPRRIAPSSGPFDFEALELIVRAGGKRHESVLYAWEMVKDKKEAKRFLKIWRHMLELVPSPTAEETAEMYR